MRWAALVLALAAPAGAGETIVSARYDDVTTRYAHGVLGDAEEWGTLVVLTSEGRRLRFVLPEERVFEDLEPRVSDLDGDGRPEVIVVESHRDFGARLAVYGMSGLIAANDWIGRSNRWLAPIGAADLDGDGVTDIAFVDRPHLAKTIRVYSYENAALTEIAEAPGYSNHRIGEDFISGGIRDCGQGPELVVARADWSGIVALRWTDGGFAETALSVDTGPEAFDAALACR
ncbi:MAG: VCBS repeat-containing protein [Paracoccaceae bacterium]|nr:VCBS repeat-containing protein [Paracoccaceae bacterium]